jgi:hypothetical protein
MSSIDSSTAKSTANAVGFYVGYAFESVGYVLAFPMPYLTTALYLQVVN